MSSRNEMALPDEVFRLALLQGLKPPLQKLVRAEARLDTVPSGATLTVQGQYTGLFCIILEGSVTSFRQNDEGGVTRLGELGPGEWFGEIGALSYRPSLATYRALAPCVFLVITAELFKELYKPKQGDFRKLIDARYRERALALHLQVAPLFMGLSEKQLGEIRDLVEFRDYEKGVRIATGGEPADALYLVRSGAVKCTRSDRHGEHVLGYSMANSSFGERAHLETAALWPGNYETMASTSVLRIPRGIFDGYPAILDQIQATARQLVDEEEGIVEADGTAATVHVDISRFSAAEQKRAMMVEGQSVKGGKALAINMDRCIRCNACVESCVSVHEDRVPRLSKAGPRVTTDGVQYALASSCYNCEIPECMIACPHGAIRRDVNGLIRFVWDNCVGCQACTVACPYEVISMTPPPPQADAKPEFKRHWFLRTLPFIGKKYEGNHPVGPVVQRGADEKVVSALRQKEVQGKAIKCDLCAGLPFEACVYNCPTQAIWRVNPEELLTEGQTDRASAVTGASGL